MGIRFYCPRGHKLNVKAELAGKVGICPECGQRMLIPFESTRESTHKRKLERLVQSDGTATSEKPELSDSLEPPDSDEAMITIHQPAANPYPAGAQIPPELPAPNAESAPKSESSSTSTFDPSANTKAAEEPAFPFSPPEPGATGIDANLLLADPNLVWYTRGTDNQSYGPVTNVVMKAWIKERRIGPTMLIWREGWSTWLEAKNVFPELEAIFTPPVTAAALDESDSPTVAASVIVSDIVSETASHEMDRKRVASKKKKKNETRDLMLVIGLIAIIALLIVILVMILLRQPAGATTATSSIPLAISALLPQSPLCEK